ncbi:MAG TPA: RNA polymerase sigma factor [Rhodothermales bacterium]|nr:RNA polymerase sigma factor [Rhodothermales bacterium]
MRGIEPVAPLPDGLMQKSAPPPDDELVARARKGDVAAFRLLVERYEGRVFTTVVGMLGRGDEVDDVAQETFIRFYETLERFRGEASVGTYLTRIAMNLSLNAIKRRKRWTARFLSTEFIIGTRHEAAVDSIPGAEQSEQRERIRKAVDTLEPKLRAVVVLRMVDEYSTRETADILGVPLGTVLSRLSRAQAKLRKVLGPYYNESNAPI